MIWRQKLEGSVTAPVGDLEGLLSWDMALL
jgi:hypothetical protein